MMGFNKKYFLIGVCVFFALIFMTGVLAYEKSKVYGVNQKISGIGSSAKVPDFDKSQCNAGQDFILQIVIIDDNRILSASQDKTIKLWDIDKGICNFTFYGHTRNIFINLIMGEYLLSSY